MILPKSRWANVLLQAKPEVDPSKTDPGELSGLIEVSEGALSVLEHIASG